jgi:membrane-associated phospholipid phosphatase
MRSFTSITTSRRTCAVVAIVAQLNSDPAVLCSHAPPKSFRASLAVWTRTLQQRSGDPFIRKLGLLVFLLGGALLAFAHVAEDYLTGDPLVRWDVHLATWLHAHSSPKLVSTFEVVTYAGNAVVLAALVATACLLLLRRRMVNEAAFLALVALGIELLNGALKLVFHRPRPELAFVHLETYSFPSGHAASATAVYGALAFLLVRRASWTRRLALWASAVLVVAVIGFSRLYLGAHYLSDVLAGFCVGGGWLFACLIAFETFGRRDLASHLAGPTRRLLDGIAR